MNLKFKEFTIEHIREVNKWHYYGIYSFYDMPSEDGLKEFLATDSEVRYFACFNGEDMIGFYCHWLEDGQMAIGLGIKPELTGQGLGKEFTRACIEFGIKRLNYKGNNVKLMVASFNERAIKIYKKLGFKETERNVLETSDGYTEFIIMAKKL